MYLTQSAQILAEHMPWNQHEKEHHDKSLMRKISLNSEISDQVKF